MTPEKCLEMEMDIKRIEECVERIERKITLFENTLLKWLVIAVLVLLTGQRVDLPRLINALAPAPVTVQEP